MVRKVLLLLLLSAIQLLFPQQKKFTMGVYSNLPPGDQNEEDLYLVDSLGVNMIVNHTNTGNRQTLQNLFDSVIVFNAYYTTDYIHHYSSGYYSKWEAEQDIGYTATTPGIKHQTGRSGGTWWESDSTGQGQLLISGPDYSQDVQYRLYYNTDPIEYIVNFRMKIDGELTPGVPVCYIFFTYRLESGEDTTWGYDTLYADDLSNSFDTTTFYYQLPATINGEPTYNPGGIEGYIKSGLIPGEEDYNGPYGIQFKVRWLGNRKLYVDYIEVYDEAIWRDEFINQPPDTVRARILSYADTAGTNNTRYWYSLDEPQSIDNYTPYRIVDSILRNANPAFPPLITSFSGGYDGWTNNEYVMKRFIDTVKPKILMYDYHPYYNNWDGVNYNDSLCLGFLRKLLQLPFDQFPIN